MALEHPHVYFNDVGDHPDIIIVNSFTRVPLFKGISLNPDVQEEGFEVRYVIYNFSEKELNFTK